MPIGLYTIPFPSRLIDNIYSYDNWKYENGWAENISFAKLAPLPALIDQHTFAM
jgi:hypothetical protein